jgi:hypothetical protein
MTMTEALVAIFVVALGLTGVMALFPFAASQMSQALVSDRTTTLATDMDGFFRSYWKEHIVEDSNRGSEPLWNAMDNPGGGLLPIPADSSESSYPVFVDPMGYVGRGGANQNWVGDLGNLSFVPRRNINMVGANSDLALRLFSQADGFSWTEDSTPRAGVEMRELRYNSLIVVQRPTNRDRFSATLKVVVFDKRRHLFYPNGSEVVFNNIAFQPTRTVITLPTTADIKKGSWIMDGTIGSLPGPTYSPIRHANFYRVVSTTDNGNGTFDVELHTPIRRVDGSNAGYIGTVVVLSGVADVYDRPVLTGGMGP